MMENTENNDVEIILVEDNPDDAALTIRALRKHNLVNKLVHLPDGAEALDFLFGTGNYANRNTDNLPKFILLDLKMPKINGIEVLQKVKADARTKMIPVVVLTSSAEDPDIKICYDLGANSYIIKPVEFDNFVKTVTEIGLYWMIRNQPPV